MTATIIRSGQDILGRGVPDRPAGATRAYAACASASPIMRSMPWRPRNSASSWVQPRAGPAHPLGMCIVEAAPSATALSGDTVTKRGKPCVNNAKYGGLQIATKQINTITLLPQPLSDPEQTRRGNQRQPQPRQKRPSNQSGVFSTGTGPTYDSTSAMVAFGNNKRAPGVGFSGRSGVALGWWTWGPCGDTQAGQRCNTRLDEFGGACRRCRRARCARPAPRRGATVGRLAGDERAGRDPCLSTRRACAGSAPLERRAAPMGPDGDSSSSEPRFAKRRPVAHFDAEFRHTMYTWPGAICTAAWAAEPAGLAARAICCTRRS